MFRGRGRFGYGYGYGYAGTSVSRFMVFLCPLLLLFLALARTFPCGSLPALFGYLLTMFVAYNITAAGTNSPAYQRAANAVPYNAPGNRAARAANNSALSLAAHFMLRLLLRKGRCIGN